MPHTPASLAKLIAHDMEPEHADRVLAALRPSNGQIITTRLLDRLPGGRVEWKLAREMGRTWIRNRAYKRDDAPDGMELTLARTEGHALLDVAWVEVENPRYFAGRRDRNAQRKRAMADSGTLSKLAYVMNEIDDLHSKLAFAHTRFVAFTTNTPLAVARYTLERACGLRTKEERLYDHD